MREPSRRRDRYVDGEDTAPIARGDPGRSRRKMPTGAAAYRIIKLRDRQSGRSRSTVSMPRIMPFAIHQFTPSRRGSGCIPVDTGPARFTAAPLRTLWKEWDIRRIPVRCPSTTSSNRLPFADESADGVLICAGCSRHLAVDPLMPRPIATNCILEAERRFLSSSPRQTQRRGTRFIAPRTTGTRHAGRSTPWTIQRRNTSMLQISLSPEVERLLRRAGFGGITTLTRATTPSSRPARPDSGA